MRQVALWCDAILLLCAGLLSVSRIEAQVGNPTPSVLPAATVNQPYEIALTFQNPFAPRGCLDFWRLEGPPGFEPDSLLGFACNIGDLAGTTPNHPASYVMYWPGIPTTVGTFPVKIRVTGRSNLPGSTPTLQTFTLSLQVKPAPIPLQITTPSPLPGATVGRSYSISFQADGGAGDYFWSILDPLPGSYLYLQGSPNVTLTPSAAGDFTFRIQVRDGAGETVTKQFSLHVSAGPVDSPVATLTLSVSPDTIDLPAAATPMGKAFGTGIMSAARPGGTAVATVTATDANGKAVPNVQVSISQTIDLERSTAFHQHMDPTDQNGLASLYPSVNCSGVTDQSGRCTATLGPPPSRISGGRLRPIALTLAFEASATSSGQVVRSSTVYLTHGHQGFEKLTNDANVRAVVESHPDDGSYGHPTTVSFLKRAGAIAAAMPDGCRILPFLITGISLRDGGVFDHAWKKGKAFTDPHKAHQAGNDIDVATGGVAPWCRASMVKAFEHAAGNIVIGISYPESNRAPDYCVPTPPDTIGPPVPADCDHFHIRLDITGQLRPVPAPESLLTESASPPNTRAAVPGSPLSATAGNFGQGFRYSYTLRNSISTTASLESLRVAFTGNPSSVASPAGWFGSASGAGEGVAWSALVPAVTPPGWIDLGGIPPSPAAVSPGSQADGFGFQSPYPPAIVTFSTRTYRPLPNFASEDDIEDDIGTPPPPAAVFNGSTIGPRRPTVDARAVLNDLLSQTQLLRSAGWITPAASTLFAAGIQSAIAALANPAQAVTVLGTLKSTTDAQRGNGANEEAWAILYWNAHFAQSLLTATGCQFTLDPPGLTVNGSASFFNIHLTASADNCPWTASSSDSWAIITTPVGIGSGDVVGSVQANLGAGLRSTILNIAGNSLSLAQISPVPPNYQPTPSARFVPVAPCRVVDTRSQSAGALRPAEARTIPVATSPCRLPLTAEAYSFNITVVPKGPLSYLTIWPTGQPRPVVSTLNSFEGQIVANAAIVPAGLNGSVDVFVTNESDVVIDVNGYFDRTTGLPFFPLNPCRLADTRGAPGLAAALSVPALAAATSRSFPLQAANCALAANAAAYSLNVTVVPDGPLGYLTLWPSGQGQPLVSTLNSADGRIVANAALVPAGTGGAISAFVTNRTDLIFDVNGYFGASGTGPLNFHRLNPCRVADTRASEGFRGSFGSPSIPGGARRDFPLPLGSCGVPDQAKAYSLNITVVPKGRLGYLTLWPTGGSQPFVSTLNAPKGNVVANAAIVPAGVNGSISVFVTNAADVIIDVNGFFSTQ